MSFSSSAAAVDALGDFDAMDDGALVCAVRLVADHARTTAMIQARGAAAVARRSDPSLGMSGLARRNGYVNAESFLQSETGSTKAEATKLVRVGAMLDADSATWHGALGGALSTGGVSVDAAQAIRVGLGGSAASVHDLVSAAQKLVDVAGSIDADELGRRARMARDELDADSIVRREKERRELRYFSARQRDDGMVIGGFALSDEDGALLLSVYQQATSPRNLGPQFVDSSIVDSSVADSSVADSSAPSLPPEPAPPGSALADLRTRGQKAAHIFAGLLRIGAETDGATILGLNRPAVRVHVPAEAIAKRAGHGIIEDSNNFPISFTTVERHLCSSGVIGVAFDDDGQALNVGRDHRLFTRSQRIALAARDGGCRFPDCARPVSWTEARHLNYWQRDHGETNIADGILLCRLHHLLIHDNHWHIRRERGHYWLTPPPDIDPTAIRRVMPSKQPLVSELHGAH